MGIIKSNQYDRQGDDGIFDGTVKDGKEFIDVLSIISRGTEIFLDIADPVNGGIQGMFLGETGLDERVVILLGICDKFLEEDI
jgi:hypothetical protein